MVATAVQLYTLDGFAVSEPKKIRIAAETGVDGVEMVYDGAPTEETVAALDETGLSVAGLSIGPEDLDDPIERIVAACERLDCSTVVLGYLGPEHYRSPEAIRETARLLSTAGETFAECGLRFLYHTHRHEFESVDGRRDLLAAALGVEDADDRAGAIVEAVTAVRDGLGLPSGLRELEAVERDALPAVAHRARSLLGSRTVAGRRVVSRTVGGLLRVTVAHEVWFVIDPQIVSGTPVPDRSVGDPLCRCR